ncbi:transcription factor TFIIE beta subunit, TFIIEB, Tfa2 [Coemansia aciculifera]|uniref:Transcription factor TFIIE beta subunit, TFIIEB, Tfa2 n=1 Tax=Coemansia aciculifera TaxID=417176 RepID=A0ACC1M6K2_9FUNG|nr:transcription factor TFIIE beta subunit, TFIIEB, Tfa2 [Coemansia aciculifera]KAJ2897715.1 transcription factor TFIIE beta subunit, TFIIEB, Tfa2 [Coemansia aciculifera]
MSDLLSQRKDFKKRVATQPIVTQRRALTPSTAMSSRVQPRQLANATQIERAHEEASVLTRVHQIITFLKQSQRPCTADEIRLHISEFHNDGPEFQHLTNNAKVIHDAQTNTFSYRPEFDLRTADELVEYLKKLPDGGGLEVKKLADSYLDTSSVIAELHKNQKILIMSDKTKRPRYIFYNRMALETAIDEDVKTSWQQLQVPDEPELSREMERAGLKRMQAETREEKEQQDVKKTKRSSRNTKITNTHLVGIDLTKDYVPEGK